MRRVVVRGARFEPVRVIHTSTKTTLDYPQSGVERRSGGEPQYVCRRAISFSIRRSMTMYFSIRRRSSLASGV